MDEEPPVVAAAAAGETTSNNNIYALHINSINRYKAYKERSAEIDGYSDDDGDGFEEAEEIIKAVGGGIVGIAGGGDGLEKGTVGGKVLRRHLQFPDLTNKDVETMASFFSIDINPSSEGNIEHYYGSGGGRDDGSSPDFISGPAFLTTLTHRLDLMIKPHINSGTELLFMQQLFKEFPTLYVPKDKDYLKWIKYFLQWISILNDVPNINELIEIPRTVVIQSAPETLKKLMRRMRKNKDYMDSDDEDDDEEDAAETDKGEEYGVLGVTIKNVYPAVKKSATVHAVLTMIEILNDKYGITIDSALNKVRVHLENSKHRLAVRQTIDLINMHIHNYDLIDMDDTVQFLDEVTQMVLRSNVVFPAPFCTVNHIERENRQFFKFDKIKLFNNFNITPKDFYSIHFTSITNYTTLHSIMKAHALTSTGALAILQDLTRVRHKQTMNAFQSDLTLFRRMLDVIRTGIYPNTSATVTSTDPKKPGTIVFTQQPRTMSVKKRYTCLMLAQMYVELKFDAFLKCGRFDVSTNAFLWHSLFFRLPNLFESLCKAICDGYVDLADVPMELLYDLDDKCNAYLSDFKQYTFASIDSPDSVLLPEVARPVQMAALYVDILTNYRLLDINSTNVVQSYYDRVMKHSKNPEINRVNRDAVNASNKFEYDVVAENARSDRKKRRRERLELTWDNRNVNKADQFRELAWSPMFPTILRNRLVAGTCGRRIRGLSDVADGSLIGEFDSPDVPAVSITDDEIKWSRENHETSGMEYTCLFMSRSDKTDYDEHMRVYKTRTGFAIPPGGSNPGLDVNALCDNWDPSSKSSGAVTELHSTIGDQMSEYTSVVMEGAYDNDIITNTLTGYAGPDGTLAMGIPADAYGNRSGYPGGVDVDREPKFDAMQHLEGYMHAIQVMQFDTEENSMNENIIKIAVQNAIESERKRLLADGGGGGDKRIDVGAPSPTSDIISHYGYANKHQIMTIESIFRYLYVHRRSIDLLKFGISQGIHPISLYRMCSTRDASFNIGTFKYTNTTTTPVTTVVSRYFSAGSEKSTSPKAVVDARRLLTGWLRRNNTLRKSDIYADITQSFMAMFQIGAEALKYQMNLANCSIIDFITYVFNFAICTHMARNGGGGGRLDEQRQVLLERKMKRTRNKQQLTVGDALEAAADSLLLENETSSWADEPRPSIMMRFSPMFTERMTRFYVNKGGSIYEQRVYYNDRTFFNDHVETDLSAGNYMNTLRTQLDAVTARNRRYMERGAHPNQRRDVVTEILDNMPYNAVNTTNELIGGTEWTVDIHILSHVNGYIARKRNEEDSYAVKFYAVPSASLMANPVHEKFQYAQLTETAATASSSGGGGGNEAAAAAAATAAPQLRRPPHHLDTHVDVKGDLFAIACMSPTQWNQSEIDYAYDLLQEVIPLYLFDPNDASQKQQKQLYVVNNRTKKVEVNMYLDQSDVDIYNGAVLHHNTVVRGIYDQLRIAKSKLITQLNACDNETDKSIIRERLGEVNEKIENYEKFASYGGEVKNAGMSLDVSSGAHNVGTSASTLLELFNDVNIDDNGVYRLAEGTDTTSDVSTSFAVIERPSSKYPGYPLTRRDIASIMS